MNRETEALYKIEAEKDIDILYAVESGSRAWGFASPDKAIHSIIARGTSVIKRPIAIPKGNETMTTQKQFEQAAQNLYNEIEYQGLSTEVIREFLCTFAEHVLARVVPNDLQESATKKSIREIVQSIDDMEALP